MCAPAKDGLVSQRGSIHLCHSEAKTTRPSLRRGLLPDDLWGILPYCVFSASISLPPELLQLKRYFQMHAHIALGPSQNSKCCQGVGVLLGAAFFWVSHDAACWWCISFPSLFSMQECVFLSSKRVAGGRLEFPVPRTHWCDVMYHMPLLGLLQYCSALCVCLFCLLDVRTVFPVCRELIGCWVAPASVNLEKYADV